MQLNIREADLTDKSDGQTIVTILDSYASDPIGGGKPLTEDVRNGLVTGLRQHPTTTVLLAFDEGLAVGLAICFLGFSTFQAKPLLNIHDLAVLPTHRGKGIGRQLLQAAEKAAIKLGCCKLTLEVVNHNERAYKLYQSHGFGNGSPGDSETTHFLAKHI